LTPTQARRHRRERSRLRQIEAERLADAAPTIAAPADTDCKRSPDSAARNEMNHDPA